MEKEPILIAGAGLVGALLGALLAQEGYPVSIYERRPDPRLGGQHGGRSINLALSQRGWKALRMAGVAEEVGKAVIPMHGRMVHSPSGELNLQPYGKEGQFINSVSRAGLNALLLQRAEACGASVHFGWRCLEADPEAGRLVLEQNGRVQEVQAPVVIGADGAFSAVRGALQKTERFNYAQHYIPHGYKELAMPPLPGGGFRMEPNALHIWPRHQFMLIALPNPDATFTCTLFLAFEGRHAFERLQTPEAVRAFFQEQFPDVLPHIPDLEEQFLANPTGSLVTVRCSPWHRGRTLLVGDAAHAIVPFYGQGMNAGFEDCTVLMGLLRDNGGDWPATMQAFAQLREPDGNAIADLALRNFIEMRDLVANDDFLLRKRIEAKLHERLKERWMPLYSMVTFSDIRYSEALAAGQRQDRIMEAVLRMPEAPRWEEEQAFAAIERQVLQALAAQ